jgi:hypothetical protein
MSVKALTSMTIQCATMDKKEKIFIQIASWRDPFVKNTIDSALRTSYNPESLVFGIVFQGYEEDNWMIEDIKSYPNVKILLVDGREASPYICNIRGYQGFSLLTDEEYYMQIDSHTRFSKNWDVYMKEELKIANNVFGKSVLSPQTHPFFDWNDESNQPGMIAGIDQDWFDNFKNPVIGRAHYKTEDYICIERFYNANTFFAYSEDVRNCRQPFNISFEFEQPFNTIRIFTAGYNIVSTSRTYTFVFDYHRNVDIPVVRHIRSEEEIQKDAWGKAHIHSEQRFQDVLNNNIIDHSDGLYDKRTFKDFIVFSGYDPLTMKVYRERKAELIPGEYHYVDRKEIADRLIKR